MERSEPAGSGDSELIRRLLDLTPDTEPAPPREPAEPPGSTLEPEGATLIDDDWDERGSRVLLSQASAIASRVGQERVTSVEPGLRHAARLALFALAVVGALAGLGVAWLHLTSDPLADARAYYNAAVRLNLGQPLYPPGIDPGSNLAYLYPPLLAIVLRPLALLPYEWFALLWEALVVASFAALLWRLGVRSQRTWLAVGILGIPIGWALGVAQAQVPMTLLLSIGQPWSIALAANLKLFPVLAALWWIGRRDYQATIAFILWLAILGLAQLLLEPAGTLDFLRTVGLGQLGEVRNVSPYALSPALWVTLVLAGIALALLLARTRWGWPAAVALATLASPRLLLYMFSGLLAALRQPSQANLPEPVPRPWLMVSGGGRH